MKRKIFFIIAWFVLVTTTSLFYFSADKTTAAVPIPFGGNTLVSFYCTCSSNYLIKVGTPIPGLFTYQERGTILDLNGNIFSVGPFVLGEAVTGGGVCEIYVAVGCMVIKTEGVIVEVGTS